jgi:hypothetical protein
METRMAEYHPQAIRNQHFGSLAKLALIRRNPVRSQTLNVPEDAPKARDTARGNPLSAKSNDSTPENAETVTEVLNPGADAITEVVQGEPPTEPGTEMHQYPPPSPEWLLMSGLQPQSPPVFEPPVFRSPETAGAAGPNGPTRKLGKLRAGLVLGLVAVALAAITTTVSIWLTSDRTAARAQADPSPTSAPPALQGAIASTPKASTSAKPGRSSTGTSAPKPTSRSNALAGSRPSPAASKQTVVKICARGHIENAGWQAWVCAPHGQRLTVGTVGQSLRLEAIEVYTVGAGGVCLNAHEQDTGWQGQSCQVDGATATAGTIGQSRRMEAFQIQTGSGVCASGQVQNIGWQTRTCAGPNAPVQVGTTGQSLRLEAVELSI